MERYTQYFEDGKEVEGAREKLQQKTQKQLIDIIMRLAEDMEDRTIALDDLRMQWMVQRNWWF